MLIFTSIILIYRTNNIDPVWCKNLSEAFSKLKEL